MKLQDWLSATGTTQAALAELVGVEQASISRLIPGPGKKQVRKPSLDLAERILEATGGEVTPNDFVGPEYGHLLECCTELRRRPPHRQVDAIP